MKKNSLMLIAAFALAVLLNACAKDSTYLIDEVLDVNTASEDVRIMKQHISVPGTDQTVDLIVVLKGEFTMGADYLDPDAYSYEHPQHKVIISKDFAFAEVPVTQALYAAVMDTNPVLTWASEHPRLSGFLGDDKPIVWVTYEDATEFCRRLSAMTGKTFSLPTEAQWEYVARGGHAARRVQTVFAGNDRLDSFSVIGGRPYLVRDEDLAGMADGGRVWLNENSHFHLDAESGAWVLASPVEMSDGGTCIKLYVQTDYGVVVKRVSLT